MKKKESLSRKIFIVVNILFMIALMVIMVFPYINVLAKSLNDGADTARGGGYNISQGVYMGELQDGSTR